MLYKKEKPQAERIKITIFLESALINKESDFNNKIITKYKCKISMRSLSSINCYYSQHINFCSSSSDGVTVANGKSNIPKYRQAFKRNH